MSTNDLPASEGFLFFERKQCDLPYYRPAPEGFSMVGWFIVLAAVAVSFVVLNIVQQRFHSRVAGFIPPLLFVLIPLFAVAVVAGTKAPSALFKPVGLRDIGLIVLFFVLNAIVTLILGAAMNSAFHTAANPATDMVATASQADQILFFLWSAVQLLGEEIFTILIFLGAMAGLNRVMPRKLALCLAVLIAAIVFGLIHLPTYQGNLIQAAALVPVRIVLLMPYLITRNIWTSTGTHILNDWSIFGLAAFGATHAG
ncbi:CPBP family intramembrane glutamic endopeptidase [Ponticoccus alexandrii]|uniref:CPBP family intramembrane metalloprotease n=1 Tax=Ponticoccus alexandrii TaxID=1943633 RepID=A0ABX7F6G5_9RHOB|nr:CPBP family intramembrane glutamic endopeptidase [Ponticoccus alexandrii]ETA53815.1 CAAX protease [Rhodobacteraceae bacterium PD-2]QRF66120.1 CPBP family intramembrane metalloprotease [Ponticoccus alexandrii]